MIEPAPAHPSASALTAAAEPARIIVIGASAGGLEALLEVISRLPADLPAAVCVVLHLPAGARSALARILTRAGPLPAMTAHDGAPLAARHIYVAPPNHYHLVLAPGHLRLVFGPRENRTRPAADPLFRSAAQVYGPRVLGVVLSGTGADGSEGLRAITAHGGVAIVQDPEEAQFAGMPHVAIHRDAVTHIRPAAQIGPLLAHLARTPLPAEADPPEEDPPADGPADPADTAPPQGAAPDPSLPSFAQLPRRLGEAAGLMCPDCGGPLWDAPTDVGHHFECRVGHSWSDANSLAESQSLEVERLAWAFINALAERAVVMQIMSAEEAEGEENLASRADSVRAAADQLAALIIARLPTVL